MSMTNSLFPGLMAVVTVGGADSGAHVEFPYRDHSRRTMLVSSTSRGPKPDETCLDFTVINRAY